MPQKAVIAQKLRIAEKVVRKLRKQLGRELLAAGVCGSIARDTAERYSDIDLRIILRRPHPELPCYEIIQNTYCSQVYETPWSLEAQLHSTDPELPEILGGLTKIKPIYDPKGLFPAKEAEARRTPAELFHKSAELGLLHSYEDFCRTKNAYLKRDEIVLKDNILAVTHSAANIVAAINQRYFVSDREIFKAHKTFRKLPTGYRRIEMLRYGCPEVRELFQMFLSFYLDLVRFCRREGIRFPVTDKALIELHR